MHVVYKCTYFLHWCYNPVWVLASSMVLLHMTLEVLYKYIFWGVGSFALRPTPNLGDQELHFVWPLPCAPASITLQGTGAHKPPLLDKGVVLEEAHDL
jgi:hypothetical protein